MISFTVGLCVLFSAFSVVEGTLTPDGTVPLDCGSQQTFTCSVSGVAAWTISLDGISITANTGQFAANNTRITTPDSGAPPSSTITITGFTTTDNGGTIQCIDLANPGAQGMASISVDAAACANNVSAARSGNFASATVYWQLNTPTNVTFTTVSYSPMSPNGRNSMMCMNSPCTITGLDPCVEYNFTVTPNNNCGNTTGCPGNSAVVNPQGVPSCRLNVTSTDGGSGSAIVTWQQRPNTPPVTFSTVTYSPMSPNGRNSMMCMNSPCTITGLDPGTYQFTFIPNNNCGSPTGCTGNMATATITDSAGPGPDLLVLLLLLLLLIPCMYPLGVLSVWRCCYKDRSYCEVFWCCCCCGYCTKGHSGRNSTEPMKSPTGDDDAQDKTGPKEEKLTYAALEFSEQAGSTGEKKIRSQEEPVQYAAVDHA